MGVRGKENFFQKVFLPPKKVLATARKICPKRFWKEKSFICMDAQGDTPAKCPAVIFKSKRYGL